MCKKYQLMGVNTIVREGSGCCPEFLEDQKRCFKNCTLNQARILFCYLHLPVLKEKEKISKLVRNCQHLKGYSFFFNVLILIVCFLFKAREFYFIVLTALSPAARTMLGA